MAVILLISANSGTFRAYCVKVHVRYLICWWVLVCYLTYHGGLVGNFSAVYKWSKLTYNINILFNHSRQWRNEESATADVAVKPRLHDTTCCQTACQTGCQTGLTAGCQTGCTTRFDNRLDKQWLFVQPGWTNSGCLFNTVVKPVVKPVWPVVKTFDNRFDNRLCPVNGVLQWVR